ncbi:hypothetical protein VTK26DRAFT_5582 [Humicola hyalothermophila]
MVHCITCIGPANMSGIASGEDIQSQAGSLGSWLIMMPPSSTKQQCPTSRLPAAILILCPSSTAPGHVTPLMLDGEGMPPFPGRVRLLPAEEEEKVEGDGSVAEGVAVWGSWVRERKFGACGGVDVPGEGTAKLSATAHDIALQLCHPLLESPRPAGPARACQFPAWWQKDVDGERGAGGWEPRRAKCRGRLTGHAGGGLQHAACADDGGPGGEEEWIMCRSSRCWARSGLLAPYPCGSAPSCVDVMAFNAGYGGFMDCVVNGVHLVAAGLTNNKCKEVATKVERTGVGVNLRTGPGGLLP